MSADKFEDAERVAQAWLNRHRAVFQTHRAYAREYRRLFDWSLARSTAPHECTSDEIDAYFVDYAAGKLPSRALPPEGPPKLPSAGTVERARSILRHLFWDFIAEGLIDRNPLVVPHKRSRSKLAPSESVVVPSWRIERGRWLREMNVVPNDRDPVVRAIAIAELAYWTGLRSSELAAARMADVQAVSNASEISVHRFGGATIENVVLPQPAFKALEWYRQSRGLPPQPTQSEVDVPLIARLRSELPVTAWTVRQALNALQMHKEERKQVLAPRDLRNELVATALDNGIPADEIAAHARSRHALLRAIGRPQPERRLLEARLIAALSPARRRKLG